MATPWFAPPEDRVYWTKIDGLAGLDAWAASLDAAQAADVRAEAAEAAADRWRWDKKQKARRSAKAVAQFLLGRRMRQAGVAYGPELDQLEVDYGDGTEPCHWRFILHGIAFSLMPYEHALRVSLPDEGEPLGGFRVVDILELGRAVKALGCRP